MPTINAKEKLHSNYKKAFTYEHVEKSSIHFSTLESEFKKVIAPIYGDQTKALEKIKLSIDRKSILLKENDLPVGILVFKTQPSSEYINYEINSSIEIKSLFVIGRQANSYRGIGSELLEIVLDYTSKAQAKSVHVTVSSLKDCSLNFFLKKGFVCKGTWPNPTNPELIEYILHKKLN